MCQITRSLDEHGPETINSRCSTKLGSDEQVYYRRLSVGQEAERLDYGWIQNPKFVAVCNRSRKATLGIYGPSGLVFAVPPGQIQPLWISGSEFHWVLQSESDTQPVSVEIFVAPR